MWKLLCILFFLAAPLAALGQNAPPWLETKTEHFTVLTDAGDKQARHVAAQFERMHDLFAKLLPHATGDAGSPIVVLALRSRKDMQALEPAAYLQKNALDLAGLFMRKQDGNYILLRLDTNDEHAYSTVYHEYTHYMLRHADHLPLWLNEGLAEFYQNTDLREKDAILGQPSANDILYLRQQRLLPLPVLFAVDHNSPYYHDEQKGSVFYAEAWALTHMITVADSTEKMQRLNDYYRAVSRGTDPVTAAQEAFGDLGRLQMALETYIRGADYKAFTTQLQSAVSEKSFNVEALPSADADAVRADVLIENGRVAEAQHLIDTVLSEAPNNAQVHESMGMLKLRAGDLGAARKWYSEAVALHSTNFLANYYFGTLSLGEGGEAAKDPAIEAALKRSIELNPEFAPSTEALARLYSIREEHLDEAQRLYIRAIELEPDNIDYRLNAAQLRVARKDLPSALSMLQRTLKIASRPEDVTRVQARISQVQQYQAQLRDEQKQDEPKPRLAATPEVATLTSTGQPVSPAAETGSSTPAEIRGKLTRKPQTFRVITPDHTFTTASANGPKRTLKGVMHNVGCYRPKGILLSLDSAGKNVPLYSNDMYAIPVSAANFTPDPKDFFNPCAEFEGMHASITFAPVEDKTVAGQIVAIELSR